MSFTPFLTLTPGGGPKSLTPEIELVKFDELVKLSMLGIGRAGEGVGVGFEIVERRGAEGERVRDMASVLEGAGEAGAAKREERLPFAGFSRDGLRSMDMPERDNIGGMLFLQNKTISRCAIIIKDHIQRWSSGSRYCWCARC